MSNDYIECECGSVHFLWYGDFLRCKKCFTEFKQTGRRGKRELWLRKFNVKTYKYERNWEHHKPEQTTASCPDCSAENGHYLNCPSGGTFSYGTRTFAATEEK